MLIHTAIQIKTILRSPTVQGVFVVWVVPLAPTLTINDTLHDLLQPHHVDELRVGSRGQEVQQRRWRFRWRYLQQSLLQLLAEGQFSGCLAAGLVVHRSHAGGTGKGGGADSTYPDASHTSCSCCLHVCQVHVDSRRRARTLRDPHLLAGSLHHTKQKGKSSVTHIIHSLVLCTILMKRYFKTWFKHQEKKKEEQP